MDEPMFDYTIGDDGHKLETVAEAIAYWSGHDDWGVNNIYINSLNHIFKAFGIDIEVEVK